MNEKEFSKRVLITGGAGFIGSHLSSQLTYAGHKVTSVDLIAKESSVCEHIVSDIGSFINSLMVCESMPRLFPNTDEYDYIFHLAASRPEQSIDYPESAISNNVNSLLSVLQYCRFHTHTKLIYVCDGATERADVLANPYLIGKHVCRELIYSFIKCFSVEATIVNLFNVYGSNDFDYGTRSSIIQRIKNSLITGAPFVQYGSDDVSLDFAHVSDIIAGLETIMFEMEEYWQPDYDLGSGQLLRVKDLLSTVLRLRPDLQIVNFPNVSIPLLAKADFSTFPKGWHHKIEVTDYISQWINSGCPKD